MLSQELTHAVVLAAQSSPTGVKPGDALGGVDRAAPSDANDRPRSDPLGHSSCLVYAIDCGIGALCCKYRAVDTDLQTANGWDCEPRTGQYANMTACQPDVRT